MNYFRFFSVGIILYFFTFSNSAFSEDDQTSEINALVASVANKHLPDFLELGYSQGGSESDDSWKIKYDYDSSRKWQVDPKKNGNSYSYDTGGVSYFINGAYSFSDDANPSDYSQVGAELKQRWFRVKAASKVLSTKEQVLVTECLKEANIKEIKKTVNDCRNELKIGKTEFSMFYLNLDAHAKIEGNKTFNERNYTYGIGAEFTFIPEPNSWVQALNVFEYPGRLIRGNSSPYVLWPIFILGVDRVDPKDDTRRNALAGGEENYDRLYFQLRHTSPLGTLKGEPVKLNLNYMYFEEIDPPESVKNEHLDINRYYTIAIQLPTSVIPGAKSSRSNFILSYSKGVLPFGREDEKVFEIGWRSNVDFGDMFSP